MGDWQRAEGRGQRAEGRGQRAEGRYCWFSLSFDGEEIFGGGGSFRSGVQPPTGSRVGGGNPRSVQTDSGGEGGEGGSARLKAREEDCRPHISNYHRGDQKDGDDGGANRLAKRAASTAGIYYHKRAGLLSAVSLRGLNGNAVPI